MKSMLQRCCLAIFLVSFSATVRAGENVKIVPDVIYGRKDGMALTFDVLKPAAANGASVVWVQSGGWYSGWREASQMAKMAKPFLDKHWTVFIVRHASAPKYAVPDAIDDMRRSIRVIRLKAKEFEIDPNRIGVFGGSAGGHLSLMLGTTGDDGSLIGDEIARQSSRIAAVAALYPPTDLRGWTTNPPEVIKKIPSLKPPLTFDTKKEEACSPILHVNAKTVPILLIHGDKDELVPISHSRNLMEVLEKANTKRKIVEIPGAGHAFSPKQNETIVMPAILEWFDTHLTANAKR